MRYFLGEEERSEYEYKKFTTSGLLNSRFRDTSLFYHRATFRIPEARLEFNFERIQEGKSLNRSDRSFQELPSSNRRRSSSLRSVPTLGKNLTELSFRRIIAFCSRQSSKVETRCRNERARRNSLTLRPLLGDDTRC